MLEYLCVLSIDRRCEKTLTPDDDVGDSHIEGKELFPNLQHIDPDLFSDMPHLTFLHLAVHDQLLALPPLSGVPNLRSVVFAHMFSLEHAPSLEHVPSLQRLELAYLPVLTSPCFGEVIYAATDSWGSVISRHPHVPPTHRLASQQRLAKEQMILRLQHGH